MFSSLSLYRLLARSSWQFYRRHPAQLLLSILGIVLGVAIVTAVLIANHSSQRAFALSSEALYGRATHQLTGANGIIQSDYVDLKIRFPAVPMAPVIHGHVAIGAELFSLLGLDPFAEAEFDRMRGSDPSNSNVKTESEDKAAEQSSLQNLLDPSALFISRISAEQSSLAVGETLLLNVAGRSVSATIAGTFSSDNPVASTGLLIGDIAFVQNALQRNNKIDRIDLILSTNQVGAFEDALPDSLRLSSSASRQQTIR